MPTTMTTPLSIFQHTLDPIMGFDIAPGHSLLFSAPISSNVTITPYEGRIAHLNAVGQFEMGCAGLQMPIVLFRPATPYGAVQSVALAPSGGSPSVAPGWQSTGQAPLAGMVATGGFECAASDYDIAKTYAYNDLLAALASNTDQTYGGLLTNVDTVGTKLTAPYKSGGTTRSIVGIVSSPPATFRNGNTVLRFWTYFLPGTT